MKEVFETVRWTCDVCGKVAELSGQGRRSGFPRKEVATGWHTWLGSDICNHCVDAVEGVLRKRRPSESKVVDPGHKAQPFDQVEIGTLEVGDEFTKEEGGLIYRVVGDSQGDPKVVYYRQTTAGFEALTTFVSSSSAKVYLHKEAS